MSPFGFTPDNSDDPEKNKDGESVDFAAMMAQMQQQIQQQFSALGMSAPGFSAMTEALPKTLFEILQRSLSQLRAQPLLALMMWQR